MCILQKQETNYFIVYIRLANKTFEKKKNRLIEKQNTTTKIIVSNVAIIVRI